ncbi:dihydrolipoamide acetyltransferase component of pyruvate dehydrogenase complex [Sphaerisporangium krabiense]|uniref:Dihydrolipoamide acetyltransferase component of pyruvate dehydrogenase complex n=1 Tax=Sphaerisporangium krabiense TaxID=763782 RepID=A0A7W8Z229_9ACTN|nr:dihydrolipoamide acetyltransferase family protein [Sphaerisporangium krabiense]MBB5626043.1 pyruvate dehydrogenase E2 component (dihydrolipoamide acetyltransferase) [Sphaerisporangium krabiense]GII64848.1 dihydrolipoamide acetyltransferase component of pyruvate dehydrogenase complex [Sphaerisporangium krabiense]
MNASGTEQIFRLPDLGEGLTEAEILDWRVAVGDVVTVDQIVVEVETAKAAVEVPVPVAGTVARLYGEPGAVVGVGEPLIAVTAADERYREEERAGSGNVLVGYGTGAARRSRRRAARLAKAAPPAPPASSGATSPASSGSATPAGVPARPEVPRVISPVVRRLARERLVDLATLTPSGPGGVVLRRDVDAAASARVAPDAAAPARAGRAVVPAQAGPSVLEEAGEPVRVPLRGVRRAVAEKLARSRREIPDATTWVDVDASALVELKAGIGRARPDARVGMLALFARICVAGLREFPELNAYVDTEREEIVRLPRINLGFAAQTDRGLVVPVVHDAHRLTLTELAARLRERTEQARAGALTPRQLTGGTFTLNNYGVFGVDGSTPIINHPEAAMLGVGRIIDRPWAHEGEIRLRKVAQISFTFDHRVCDGGVAGGFLRFVADCVERPEVLVANL